MDDHEFKTYVDEGIAALPEWVRKKLVNVAIFVRHNVSKRQRKAEGLKPGDTLFGLYEGVPLSERGEEAPLLPDTITIFKKPILDSFKNVEDIRECVMNTVWHEVAHFIGHGEEWIELEEVRRGKTK